MRGDRTCRRFWSSSRAIANATEPDPLTARAALADAIDTLPRPDLDPNAANRDISLPDPLTSDDVAPPPSPSGNDVSALDFIFTFPSREALEEWYLENCTNHGTIIDNFGDVGELFEPFFETVNDPFGTSDDELLDIADSLGDITIPRAPQRGNVSRNNAVQNRAFRSSVTEIERQLERRLTRAEERRLHDEISKQGFSREEITEIGLDMFE